MRLAGSLLVGLSDGADLRASEGWGRPAITLHCSMTMGGKTFLPQRSTKGINDLKKPF